jgi:hypothetical protein
VRWVEEVESCKELTFHSIDDLIKFSGVAFSGRVYTGARVRGAFVRHPESEDKS